ncbi:hypothetical protein CRYUN_Cryun02cG0160600 [Craigia yunnanensis]
MLGDIEGGTRRHSVNCGMTPRVFEYLFTRIQKEKEARKDEKLRFTCKCSFLEIYNEQILDLLDPSSTNLQIREDIKKGVYVENLKDIEVTSARDVIQQLIQGAANRKVGATNMNRASSRSHSVFTCIIESQWESQGVTHHRFAQLNLVDLAGSERQKSSGAEGERLKEATNINKSLSTLGLVIMNLVNISNGKSLHVPYRDSKLTFLLQDSLGGNAKTIIIANISPSNCCSLETLSTLKFAQRAKFIKNNAVVNEDASGDVVAMRLQIQQLKKEVSRLRGFVNGRGENLDDTLALSFPASPGSFKWEGLHGSLSPLTSDKRISQKKDHEVALVGAFKREREKETALQALTAENQAAMQLAKQREDEVQSLKMRLRFREAGIKRLEAVASGKISAETHLLKEKDEYLKEIEVLRAQVDRNQEVTRFAMENLRLKEEIRRLKSICEEGQQEMMNEQLKVLQNKLLEALDWKLMHESDSFIIEKTNSKGVLGDIDESNELISSQEPDSAWCSSLKEENEFLRMQAIHNQAEMDALQKRLDFCLEEKEELERYVNDLLKKLEEERCSRPVKEVQQTELHSLSVDVPMINLNDQMELKTMVDAIAAASQREAEAHERAFKLSQENDELRLKLKGYVEDNKQLLELYEQKAAENNYKSLNEADTAHENDTTDHTDAGLDEHGEEKEVELKKVVDNLEQQLMEMHEENEKLMGLYERAMQERDEFKRMFSSGSLNRREAREFECPEKLVEVYGGEDSLDKAHVQSEHMQDAGESLKLNTLGPIEVISNVEVHADLQSEAGNQIDDTTTSYMEIDDTSTAKTSEDLNYARAILEKAQEKLSDSAKTVTEFGSLEKAFCEIDKLSREIEVYGGEDSLDKAHVQSEHMQDAGESLKLNTLGPIEVISNVEVHADLQSEAGNQIDDTTTSYMEIDDTSTAKTSEDLNYARAILEKAQEKLSDSAKTVTEFGSLEKAFCEIDKLSREIEVTEGGIKEKQQHLESVALVSSEAKERKALTDNKLSALKYSVSRFSSSVAYFEQREARARTRLSASLSCLDKEKEELAPLKKSKGEIEASLGNMRESEAEARSNLVLLKSKLEEESKRQENGKVLFAIDNLDKVDSSQRNLCLGGKATELLKTEEEKSKLQNEIKLSRENLGAIKMRLQDLNKKLVKVENDIEAVLVEVNKGSKSVEELELALQGVIQEKEALVEIGENGKTEIELLILEYQQNVFDIDLTEAEMKIIDEELQLDLRRLEQLQTMRVTTAKKVKQLAHSGFFSENLEEDLRSACATLEEAKILLGVDHSNDC